MHSLNALIRVGMAAVAMTVLATSFADAENGLEANFRVEIEVLPSTRGYIGYRYLAFDLDTAGEVVLDDNVNLGIRIQF